MVPEPEGGGGAFLTVESRDHLARPGVEGGGKEAANLGEGCVGWLVFLRECCEVRTVNGVPIRLWAEIALVGRIVGRQLERETKRT